MNHTFTSAVTRGRRSFVNPLSGHIRVLTERPYLHLFMPNCCTLQWQNMYYNLFEYLNSSFLTNIDNIGRFDFKLTCPIVHLQSCQKVAVFWMWH